MGSRKKRFRFQHLFFTVMLFVMPYNNLQILSSAMNIPPTIIPPKLNFTTHELEWNTLKAKCRFGELQPDGNCRCRSAECNKFGNDSICMSRDSGNHWTFPNDCYMLEHACNNRKKRLFYWKGTCISKKGLLRDVTGEYCEGDDVFYCENDGICKYVPGSKQLQCLCKSGYGGKRCENKVLFRKKRYNIKRLLRLRKRARMKRLIWWRLKFRTKRSLSVYTKTGFSNIGQSIT